MDILNLSPGEHPESEKIRDILIRDNHTENDYNDIKELCNKDNVMRVYKINDTIRYPSAMEFIMTLDIDKKYTEYTYLITKHVLELSDTFKYAELKSEKIVNNNIHAPGLSFYKNTNYGHVVMYFLIIIIYINKYMKDYTGISNQFKNYYLTALNNYHMSLMYSKIDKRLTEIEKHVKSLEEAIYYSPEGKGANDAKLDFISQINEH